METQLVQIGNSQGVRLPKAVIEQAGLTDRLELQVAEGAVVIRAAKRPREGWESAAIAMHAADEDRLDDFEAAVDDFHGDWN